MSSPRLVTLACVLTLLTGSYCQADAKWSLRNLLPGQGDDEPPAVRPMSEKPSALSRINQSTKNAFAKTKAMVPNWLLPKTQKRARQSSSLLKKSTDRVRQDLRTARRTLLSPWKKQEKKTEGPRTVSEFLAQPRPEF